MVKALIASIGLAASLFGVVCVSCVAAASTRHWGDTASAVAAVVQAADTVNVNENESDTAVVELNNSFSNLRGLKNVLNNNDIDITLQDIDVLGACRSSS